MNNTSSFQRTNSNRALFDESLETFETKGADQQRDGDAFALHLHGEFVEEE
jgi:hypothetical protein